MKRYSAAACKPIPLGRDSANLRKPAGFDYVFLDMEHTSFDLETMHDMIEASLTAGITPIVRPCELLYSLFARLLDSGAQGIIFPRVEDPRLLEEAMSWMRFPPAGKRGYGMNAPLIGYEARTFPEIIEHLNRNTMSVVQFETVTAMERADELLSVKGMDVAMVGPADLSIALGVPGELEHPKLIATVEKLIERCNHHGVVPGIQTRSVAMAKAWTARGMRFLWERRRNTCAAAGARRRRRWRNYRSVAAASA